MPHGNATPAAPTGVISATGGVGQHVGLISGVPGADSVFCTMCILLSSFCLQRLRHMWFPLLTLMILPLHTDLCTASRSNISA